jgi:hypothetical protein
MTQLLLPSQLAESPTRALLKGSLKLTVVSYRDVGKPLPLALAAVGEEAPNEPHVTPTRMLKLLVSDGARDAVAMEYEYVQALDDVRVGSQIVLEDIYVVRGMLLLTKKSVKLVKT